MCSRAFAKKVYLDLQDIHKLGVGISGDAQKLQRDFGVQCSGLVCLSEEASMRLAKEQMPETRGLAGKPTRHHCGWQSVYMALNVYCLASGRKAFATSMCPTVADAAHALPIRGSCMTR